MKVYAHPASMNSRKVLMVAHHLGLDLENVLVDLFKGQQHYPAFVALNPNRLVPVLVDADLTLWESNAIVHYLAGVKSGGGLWPSGPAEQADVLRWLSWEQTQFAEPCLRLSQEFVFKPFAGVAPDPLIVERAHDAFQKAAAVLDSHLADRKFLVGENLSLADFAVASQLTHAEEARIQVSTFPSLAGWFEVLASTSAWRACDGRLKAVSN